MHGGITLYTVHELPVFEPNEYFWKHHWDGKEQRWQAYARAVRTIMIEQGNLLDTASSMEDRLEYKKCFNQSLKPRSEWSSVFSLIS